MDLEYDQKFEEMKKYIPFLENMIKRLESTSGLSANPRQAQLDKIRSLRDLLLNKKKRMKMENLLKCEQVLVNLYAKVEQRDSISGLKKEQDSSFSIDPPTPKEKSELEAVRNKLKTVAKRQEVVKETLPEILSCNEIDEVHCTAGKEPALFQRRPNKASLSPNRHSPKKSNDDKVSPQSASKRNYTRVLVSPERQRWSPTEPSDEKPLFSRRSPRKTSPLRRVSSPSYSKREKKKSLKESSRKSKDLNITLNVPEDSLSSLNTKDIFTRIINCSDGDVDIDTLRELRKQILTELQKTGARDDISDLILKSYNKKKKHKKKEEVEEGELSDSESEVIENVYSNISGNLVLKDQNEAKNSSDKEKARKIQICLVINSDKDNTDKNTTKPSDVSKNSEISELEMYDNGDENRSNLNKSNIQNKFKTDDTKSQIDDSKTDSNKDDNKRTAIPDIKSPNKAIVKSPILVEIDSPTRPQLTSPVKPLTTSPDVKTNPIEIINKTVVTDDKKIKEKPCEGDTINKELQTLTQDTEAIPTGTVLFKANFYKPLIDKSESLASGLLEENKETEGNKKEIYMDTQNLASKVSTPVKLSCNAEKELENQEKPTEIPLLNEPTLPEKPTKSTVSEIDILQALKNEILSETITIPGSDASTPLLHQPKLNKVANANEILPKKRISIEKYKEKAVNSSNPKLYLDDFNSLKDDHSKKTSLKLTEKECERFNFPIHLVDSSESDGDDIQVSDMYSDLAPKSPDRDESKNVDSKPPVIIPVDPIKTLPITHKADVDMRTLPILSPNNTSSSTLFQNVAVSSSSDLKADMEKIDPKIDQNKSQNRPLIMDPRVRRDLNTKANQSPSPHTTNMDRPRSVFSSVSQSPARNVMTAPNARSYEMTPNHQSFEIDQSSKKHVYVPAFSFSDSRDRESSVAKDRERKSRFEDYGDASWSSSDVSQSTRFSDSFTTDKYNKGQRNDRFSIDNRDPYLHKISEPSKTPQSFGRVDLPGASTPTYSRTEKPMTPLHPFGRSECPLTPSHPFGRNECPLTPSHPFGRSDCPSTPSHPFGRNECPLTPSHPFGRSECPPTPTHTFGISDCPPTPSHVFGRSDCPTTPSHPFGSHSYNVNECSVTPGNQNVQTASLFGRNEGPSSSNHSFGLLERPQTPSHSFGRSDATNHYGRSDFTNKYVKDPRLNRKSDYESNSQYDDKDNRCYYKDRNYDDRRYRGGYKSQNSFSGSDSYQNSDRDQGRNSKYRYYAPEKSRREPDRLYTRERGRYNTEGETRVYEDNRSRHGSSRDISVGRNDNLIRSSYRASSVGRNASIEPEQNTLSVKPHAGRSFTIDTSINATFQNFLSGKGIQVFEYNFDARRQRAASVGRSLVRDESENQTLPNKSQEKLEYLNKRKDFRRASSVGRDLVTEKRSLQEIKADFENYRFTSKKYNKFDTGKIKNIDTKSKNTLDNFHKKERNDRDIKPVQSTSKTPYSPRKNYRDPRMRKDYDSKNKYYDKSHSSDPRSRKTGIIYSNDNIVKGSVLTSGYGVKNYKIPKIKRPVEETQPIPPKKEESVRKTDEKDKEKRKYAEKETNVILVKNIDKSKELSNQKCKDEKIEKTKDTAKENKETSKAKPKSTLKDTLEEISDTEIEPNIQMDDDKSDEQFERRLTRSSRQKNIVVSDTDVHIVRTRKSKKAVINDSDSDTEIKTDNKLLKDDKTDILPKNNDPDAVVEDKNVCKKPKAVDIDTNFGLEELEMFSDNVVSDPVLDNINALIADLDNDLDTSKNESSNNFTKEITLENMMQNITTPQEDNLSQSSEEFSNALKMVDELSQDSNSKISLSDLNIPNESLSLCNEVKVASLEATVEKILDEPAFNKPDINQKNDDLLCKKPHDIQSEPVAEEKKQETTVDHENSGNISNPANEDIVSTTEIEKSSEPVEEFGDKNKIEKNTDGCSTPDSTINTDEVIEKAQTDDELPDSSNEVHGETNVSSTESVDAKPSSSRTETAPTSELGSLLSILQDKSKIKELLCMLGEQSDNEKIKKKLEMLSEIVSDDENEEKTKQTTESKNEVRTVDNKNTEDPEKLNEKLNVTDKKQDESNKVSENHEQDEKNDEEGVNEENDGKDEQHIQEIETKSKKKMPMKKSKISKKAKGKSAKQASTVAEKRVTRATAAVESVKKPKKPPRELQQLHEDIKEMFIRDDILSATGIRMCRLAKLVDEKASKEEAAVPEVEPVVVLQKFKNTTDKSRDLNIPDKPEKIRKKPGPKPKPKLSIESPALDQSKYKPGPKSRTKNKKEVDPYAFETDSITDTNTEKASEDESDNSSDSENCSLASSKSFGSTELLADVKKKTTKRKRRGWQDGIIKPKHKKKKVDSKSETVSNVTENLPLEKQIPIPDMNCFTDRNYCFRKNELNYSCRLCAFFGTDIVHHYKNEHPHVEIPLSRMSPQVAKEAIEQCNEINFKAIRKISSDKYVCIFCFKEFSYSDSVLESFFWHIVSNHTGEYKHRCSKCNNENPCPFSLDIPPPPKETKGQLIGYVCKKCNFTQLSLENLKTHVIVRHNDEQTAVYTINLAAMSKKAFKELLRSCDELPLGSAISQKTALRSNSYVSETEETPRIPKTRKSIHTPFHSKITFETDDNISEPLGLSNDEHTDSPIKIERVEPEIADNMQSSDTSEIDRPSEEDHQFSVPAPQQVSQTNLTPVTNENSLPSSDIVDYPHFKINIPETGAKEYICSINGNDNHFKTTLLISMKKHVQLKHSEKWDGYCYVCKVIVTPQGVHRFKDCFQHYLDKHMDNFPIYQKEVTPETSPEKPTTPVESPATSKPYINVRPLSDLISGTADISIKEVPSLPVIQSVMSLGTSLVPPPRSSPTYPSVRQDKKPTEVTFKYEEVQAEVMLKKHRVVLETMMARDKLVKVYKCAGRFCSFTSDSAEDALLHASTHQRIGGVDALNCCYCDFDAMGNAIDLVMHVFKTHGHCQYSCARCFYRAAASQSVGAHMNRVHGVPPLSTTVLRTTVVPTNTTFEANMLSREQAVPYYVCNYAERDGTCKFRTYTPDKFCEHLVKHPAATSHTCYICQQDVGIATELVQHMKSHGIKLYQCTWCVHGADNEAELLAHVSSVHPNKQPQAYLRIITNKEGSNELRVLPLAFLNKQKVPTVDIIPNPDKENPVREAERSIDLEKLIGLTMLVEPINETIQCAPIVTDGPVSVTVGSTVIKPVAAVTEPNVVSLDSTDSTAEPTQEITIIGPKKRHSDKPEVSILSNKPDSNITKAPPTEEPFVVITTVKSSQNVSQPLVKSEPLETPKTLPGEVVVLDSDDEEPKQSVIDLSDDDSANNSKTPQETPQEQDKSFASNTSKSVPADILATCPKCRLVCRTMHGLKKHMTQIHPNKELGCKCAHCPYIAKNREDILNHYVNDHCDKNIYQCGICNLNLQSMSACNKHFRNVHKEKDLVVSSTSENGVFNYVVNASNTSTAPKSKRELPKRKLSGNNSTPDVPKRRFGPQDIDQLPITPILDQLVYCDICEFSTKVRLNMVRHLQLHAEQQPVPQTAPVNPVPHLETNEKHFDKMVNLASSSIVNRAPEKSRTENTNFVPIQMPPELAARYPKRVSARQRNTCGAIGCSYTSVDEAMLKRHWETLHPGNTNFRCVHCPDTQSLDTTRPLTGSRIISHLKMHDDTLFACSKCNYYHFKREFLEKHLTEVHPDGQFMIVRDESGIAATPSPVAATPTNAAPTMDLKPWQCGLCQFKSMLRPEVADHCFKFHQSKMQYRCAYCPYRASALDNVNNHVAHSHANEPEDVIYYYYREGSLPEEPDGTPRWLKQRQKLGSAALPEVKTEAEKSPVQTPPGSPVKIDLNLVKKEVDETISGAGESIEELCIRFGKFCEPNGIKFKCPLCSAVSVDTREDMQSHLYEELKYRKWTCGLCSYKAFHKSGLSEHMKSEHRRQYDYIELPVDANIEKWVTAQLDHQAAIIDKYKINLSKQKILTERPVPAPGPSSSVPTIEAVEKFSLAQLEDAFGAFGAPKNMMYCCPKCNMQTKDEAAIRDHLEMELNKIRWGCTNCSVKYQTYHEAQFHCKGHDGPSRPKEAIRDPSMRAAWVSNIIQSQKTALLSMTATTLTSQPTQSKDVLENDNSLLMVRYEERVPTPDHVTTKRKRTSAECDDDRLVIDEAPGPNKRVREFKHCPYCDFKHKYPSYFKDHVLKHYNLKPYKCNYCNFSSYRQGVLNHTERVHPNQPPRIQATEIPAGPPPSWSPVEIPKVICLICEKTLLETEVNNHLHDGIKPDFAMKGDVVYKCCICLVLRLDVKSLEDHHKLSHPNMAINYALHKLHHDSRETHCCAHCNKVGFKFLRDMKTHHYSVHPELPLKYTIMPFFAMDEEKRDKSPIQKRCARKSTTKLPGCKKAIAKKSTTKLPFSVPNIFDDEGYTFYNTRPEPLSNYANVTTLMSFCNRMMPFTLKKLSEIINIEPKVVLIDCNKLQ